MSSISAEQPYLISSVPGSAFSIQYINNVIELNEAFPSQDNLPLDTLLTWEQDDRGYVYSSDSSTGDTKILQLHSDGKSWTGVYDKPLSHTSPLAAAVIADNRPYVLYVNSDASANLYEIKENGSSVKHAGSFTMPIGHGIIAGWSCKSGGYVAQFDDGTLYLSHLASDHEISEKASTTGYDTGIDLLIGFNMIVNFDTVPFLLMYNSSTGDSTILKISDDGKSVSTFFSATLATGATLGAYYPADNLNCILLYNPSGTISYYSVTTLNDGYEVSLGTTSTAPNIALLACFTQKEKIEVTYGSTEMNQDIWSAIIWQNSISVTNNVAAVTSSSSDTQSRVMDALDDSLQWIPKYLVKAAQEIQEVSSAPNPIVCAGINLAAGAGNLASSLEYGIYGAADGTWGVFATIGIDFGFISEMSDGITITALEGGLGALQDITYGICISAGCILCFTASVLVTTSGDSMYGGFMFSIGLSEGPSMSVYTSSTDTIAAALSEFPQLLAKQCPDLLN